MIRKRILAQPALFASALLAAPLPAIAAGSLLVWPIDPVIQSDERATALWLENRGTQPILLQLRIFGWSQPRGESIYAEQGEIVGTPPMITIAPGKRQLVRLTRTTAAPAGTEQAYRVIVDEIPTPDAPDAKEKAAVGVKFQMRYSIPLFVYGPGLHWKPAPGKAVRESAAGKPQLDWRLVTREGKRQIEVRNRGTIHARLTKVNFAQGSTAAPLAAGLLGYVLPGATAHWPVPDGVETKGALRAAINDTEEAEIAAMPQ